MLHRTSSHLHLMVGVESWLELQVRHQALLLRVADVGDAVHVVEAGPLLVEGEGGGSHVPPVKLQQDAVSQPAVLEDIGN